MGRIGKTEYNALTLSIIEELPSGRCATHAPPATSDFRIASGREHGV
jgi:hypothetical protein